MLKQEETGVFQILAVNPGSTSTKIALYDDDKELFRKAVSHNDQEIASFEHVWDQYEYRKKEILLAFREEGREPAALDCVVGRGGLFRPTISGTYAINRDMLNDARNCFQGEHASNLGCVLAYGIAWDYHLPSFVVDPPCVDEMEGIARYSGHRDISKRSIHHALNVKAVARRTAVKLGRPITDVNLVVAHIGGGISVVPLLKGRMIDTNNALSGGPFSPERTGYLPMMDFIEYLFHRGLTEQDAKKMCVGEGGMFSYLGTKSIEEVSRRIESGDGEAELVLKAMGYQIAQEIGRMAVSLKGEVDQIVLTGGAVHSDFLVNVIREHVAFLGPLSIYPGEDEMLSLAAGALRVLRGEEKALDYPVKAEVMYEHL